MDVLRSLDVMKTVLGYESNAAHGLVATYVIMPHEIDPNQNARAI
jgi:hypothetical protein